MEFCAEALINAVKDYAFLYDKRHPDHKDRDKKLQAWTEIGSIFGMAGLECQKKFKNLKDAYYRTKAAVKGKSKSGAGLADIPTVKWAHFEEMAGIVEPFSQSAVVYCSLQHEEKSSSSTSTSEQPSPQAQETGPSTASSSVVGCGLEESPAHESFMNAEPISPEEGLPAERPQTTQKRQKRRRSSQDAGEGRSHELVEACVGHLGALRALRSESKRDEIYHFCMRLDCRLRAIPKDRSQSIMNSFDNMLYHEEQECRDLGLTDVL
ncbi:uncharacterized protein ISCGN_024544 [Ixodes scapularis]